MKDIRAQSALGSATRALVVAVCCASCRSSDPEPSRNETRPWMLHAGSRSLSLIGDDALVAMDPLRGEPVWRFELPRRPSPMGEVSSRLVCEPVAVGETVLLRTDGELISVAFDSGKLLRNVAVEPVGQFASAACPAVVDSSTFVMADEGGRRLRRMTIEGAELWRFTLPDGEHAQGPVQVMLDGAQVVVRTEQRVMAIDAEGKISWRRRLEEYQ